MVAETKELGTSTAVEKSGATVQVQFKEEYNGIMVNNKVRQQLESAARDMVIGSGMAEEWADIGREPGADELRSLGRSLGRPPTGEEVNYFCTHWRRCLQEAAQP